MTKSLRSYPENERFGIAKRRATNKNGGIGYNAALDFIKRAGEVKKKVVAKEEESE